MGLGHMANEKLRSRRIGPALAMGQGPGLMLQIIVFIVEFPVGPPVRPIWDPGLGMKPSMMR